MKTNISGKILIGFLLLLISSLFYLPLFYPQLSLIFTPDLGRSDNIHYNYAKRFILSENLKHGEIPLWSGKIGTGVSLIGEGQLGTYNLVNFFLYRFFPVEVAFNLSYVVSSFLALLGTYLFLRSLSFDRFISVFGACVFAFSGFFIFRLTHMIVIASAAYLPWVFLLVMRLVRKIRLLEISLLSIVLSQQLFAGHPQMFFITVLGIVVLGFSSAVVKHRFLHRGKIAAIVLSIVLAILAASVYVIPLRERQMVSVRSGGLSFAAATYNSTSWADLALLVYPFVLGNPKYASYPLVSHDGFNIFWERNGYIGLLPFLLVFFLLVKRKKRQEELIIICAAGLSLLLALGRNGPLFWLYYLPLFNFFQVPARFLLLTTFFLAVLAAYGLTNWRGSFKVLAILLVILPAYYFTYSYHLLVPAQKIIGKPEIMKMLGADPAAYRIFQIGSSASYMEMLLQEGWQDSRYYEFSLNSLSADINVLYGVSQVEAYDVSPSKRRDAMQSLMQGKISGDLYTYEATPSVVFKQLLNITNTAYLISPFKIEDNDLLTVGRLEKGSFRRFYVYENRLVLPRVRGVGKFINAGGLTGTERIILEGKSDLRKTVILEEEITNSVQEPRSFKAEIVGETDTKVIIEASSDTKAVLVLADSFYPGWKAKVNNREAKIYAANINQRAVIVPAGESVVEFVYKPESFSTGLKVSIVSYIFLCGGLIYGFVMMRRKTHV